MARRSACRNRGGGTGEVCGESVAHDGTVDRVGTVVSRGNRVRRRVARGDTRRVVGLGDRQVVGGSVTGGDGCGRGIVGRVVVIIGVGVGARYRVVGYGGAGELGLAVESDLVVIRAGSIETDHDFERCRLAWQQFRAGADQFDVATRLAIEVGVHVETRRSASSGYCREGPVGTFAAEHGFEVVGHRYGRQDVVAEVLDCVVDCDSPHASSGDRHLFGYAGCCGGRRRRT